jgi:hypothetical protein
MSGVRHRPAGGEQHVINFLFFTIRKNTDRPGGSISGVCSKATRSQATAMAIYRTVKKVHASMGSGSTSRSSGIVHDTLLLDASRILPTTYILSEVH